MNTLLALCLSQACDTSVDGSSAAAPVVTVAGPAASVETPDTIRQTNWYYNPAGKRDPFVAPAAIRPPVFPTADVPLQRWDLGNFVLTGVIWDAGRQRALLVDPEGTGHVVQLGTYVGRYWGKVTAISDEGLVVTEEYRTSEGEIVVNPVSIPFAGATG